MAETRQWAIELQPRPGIVLAMKFRPMLCALVLTFGTFPCSAETGAVAPEFAAALELFHARRDDEARAALTALLRRDPRNHEAEYYLGRLAKRQQDWKAVAEHYERAAALNPNNPLYWVDLGEAHGMLAQRASMFGALGHARKSRAALEKAAELAPDDIAIRLGLVAFYRQAPGIAGGGIDKAHAQADEIIRRDAVRGHLAKGGLYQHEKKWAEAERSFREAARLAPESLDPPFALGQLNVLRENWSGAFAVFEEVLEDHPDNLAAMYQIGRIAALSGQRLDRGEAMLRRYLAADPVRGLPPPAAAHLRLGNIATHRGDREAARAAFEQALTLDPGYKDAAEALAKLR
jgi:tetratricopeptide (TPR) repeat protein